MTELCWKMYQPPVDSLHKRASNAESVSLSCHLHAMGWYCGRPILTDVIRLCHSLFHPETSEEIMKIERQIAFDGIQYIRVLIGNLIWQCYVHVHIHYKMMLTAFEIQTLNTSGHILTLFVKTCSNVFKCWAFCFKNLKRRKPFPYHAVIRNTFPLQSKHSLWYQEPARTLALPPYWRIHNHLLHGVVPDISHWVIWAIGCNLSQNHIAIDSISARSNKFVYGALLAVCGLHPRAPFVTPFQQHPWTHSNAFCKTLIFNNIFKTIRVAYNEYILL